MERHDCHSATPEYPHPFIHEVKLTTAQRITGIMLGSILYPIRITLVSLFFLLMWPFARLRLAGLSEEERARPVTGWRRWLFHPIVLFLSRAVFFSLGFLWVRVKGRRADLKEAPVLVVAPHSSFLDMLVLCPTELATVVSRSENTSLPVIGALLEFNQSVLVSRKDPESRKKAVAQLIERLTSNGYWPQMLMFPEGTTTNGCALLKFKLGAFLAGVPVQPVLLHYPNKLDTVRWTYKGTSWMEALWHTSSQLYTNVTVEFLPVYNPSEQEKNDPNLYADNVQKLMAKALRVPATDYVMEGGLPVSKVGGLSLPLDSPAREMLSVLHKNGLGPREVKVVLDRLIDRCQSETQGSKASAEELTSILGLKEKQAAVHICSLYSKDETVDLRHVYVSISAVAGFTSFKSLLHTAFNPDMMLLYDAEPMQGTGGDACSPPGDSRQEAAKHDCLFDEEGRGSLTADELSDLMGALLGVPQRNTAALYALASSHGQLTEENLLQVLTTHTTYGNVLREYLQPEEAGSGLSITPLAKRKAENNNGDCLNGNGSLHNKKFE